MFSNKALTSKMTSLKRKIYELTGTRFYNITSSKESGYVWFRVAKNGTRSILKVLEEKTKLDLNGSNIPYLSFRFRRQFKFCFIRNPWDRLVSCYHSKVVSKKMFEPCWDNGFSFFVDFVGQQDLSSCDRHFRLQTHLFPQREMDYVARFENFTQDFDFVMNGKLKLNVPIEHQNATDHVGYREYYDNKTKSIVERLYQEDIEFGNYIF
jgi:Sulfotransferase family